MKYFTELIESYLRLHEQTPVQGDAQSEASRLISNLSNAAPGASQPIKGNIVLVKGEDRKNIYIKGLGKFTITVIEANGAQNPEGFAKLIALLSGEEAPGEEGPGVAAGVPPGAKVELLNKYPYLPADRLANPNKVRRYIENICQEEIEEKKTVKERKAAIQECKNISKNIDRLLNNTKGSVAYTLNASTKLIVNCDESNLADCEVDSKNEQESIEHRIAAFETIQKSIDILMKAQQSDDKLLTTEDCAFLKRSISITGGGIAKKIAIVGGNKKGMLITQEKTTLLHDVLTKLTKGLKCGGGESDYFKYESDTVKFLTSAGVTGSSGSTTRGFFFEDLRAGVAIMLRCQNDPTRTNECQREASAKLLRWTRNPEVLERALRDLIEKLRRDGEFAVQLNDQAGMAFVHDFLFRALNNGEDAEQALRQVLAHMSRTASLGLIERSPFEVEKTGNIVGKGRKSDLTEYYATEEEANAAIDKMNLPPEQRGSLKVIKVGENKYSIGDSLKYSGDCKTISAGDAARSNIMIAAKDPRGHKEWFDEMEKVGVSREDVIALSGSITEFENHKRILQRLQRGNFLTKNGTVLVDQQVAAARAVSREISNILGADNPLVLAIGSKVREFVESGKNWEAISTDISDAIFKTRLQNDMLSADPAVAERAARKLATFSCFAGLSSDGTFLSVADAVKGQMYISAQNHHIKKLTERLIEISKITDIEERKKALKFNEKTIKIDGGDFSIGLDAMNCTLEIDGDYVKDNSAPPRRIKKGMETRSPQIQPTAR